MRKCLNCGCTDLEAIYPIPNSYEYRAEDGCEAYACVKCGHIEFYADNNTMNRIRKIKNDKEQKNLEIKKNQELLAQLNNEAKPLRILVKNDEIEIKNLVLKSQNDDITVKQQKELLSEVERAKEKLRSDAKVLNEIERKINELNAKNEQLKNM